MSAACRALGHIRLFWSSGRYSSHSLILILLLRSVPMLSPAHLTNQPRTVQLRNVLCGLVQIVRDYPDFVLPILSKQFPRCRTTHALTNWGKSDTTQPHGSLILMWTSLEKLCRTRCTSRCERRGCGNVAREQCSAVGCPTRYCSESCKQRYVYRQLWYTFAG